ncbi:LamG-like jellyroll fold domain-containing protein [Polluticoccus soli]|uniref:LamG-like jellyroll fold domain-containing protein n=1 Tax=Polluticoccus soli TaxID=3034150 RepID=UPI0023E0B3CE|nr:LamG-like jellyroll fold domain-containing protein [Flavipsychrobacter sp. JY13-12]
MRKNILKFVYALALLFVAGLPAESSAQFSNPGFEDGTLSGWTATSSTSVVSGFNQQSWLVTPANTRMARIEPASGTSRSSTETFLGLTAGALTNMNASVINGSTNYGSIKQSVFLGAGQTVNVYWNYVSQDYSPYNDGVFASLVGPGYQQLQLLAVTVNSFSSPGTIVTGSYGSTGWHSASFTAGAAGTYTLGLGCFNYSDQAVNPILFVDDAAGGTSAPGQPVVTTDAATGVTSTAAVTGGNVTSDGGAAVSARGVAYGTSPVPTTANNFTTDGTGTGAFTSNLSGLSMGTTYYVRSYATNSAGTSYGNEVSFTTASLPPAGALDFDGVDDYVRIANPYNSFGNELTVEWTAIIDPSSGMGSGISQSAENVNTSMQWLMHYVPGYHVVQFYINDNGVSRDIEVPVTPGWHKYTGVASPAGMKFYKDGVLVSSSPVGVTNHLVNEPNSVIALGKDSRFATQRFMKGQIDEVRIWNRALCEGEITNNVGCELSLPQNGLVEYYRFNQGLIGGNNTAVTTLTDLSASGKNGTLQNFALTGGTSDWVAGNASGTCAAFVPPVATITPVGGATGCGSVVLNANTGSGNTYQWKLTGNNIANANNSSYTATVSGSYSVDVTKTGCTATSSPLSVTVNTMPAFSACPSNMNANTTPASCNAVVNYATSATGIPAPAITYTLTGATTASSSGNGSGLSFNKGVTNVLVKATNSCGTAQCSFTVTVTDNVNPSVAAQNITAYLGASGTATITPSQVNNGSSDNCGTLNLSLVGAGSTTGTICAIGIEHGSDAVLTAPAGATISAVNFASYGTPNGSCGNFTTSGCHSSSSMSVVSSLAIGQNSVTIPASNTLFGDPCFGTGKRLYIQATYTMPKVSSLTYNCSNLGANTVTLVGTDGANNTSTTTATVTVLDTTKPVLTIPSGITVSCDGSTATSATGMASATDNCGATVSYVDASTQDANVNNAGHYNYVITRTWTATDASNNSVSANQAITVQDVTKPGITVPANVTLNCQDDNSTTANGTATGTDNCSPVAITYSDASTQDANVNNAGHYNYVITRTWTATDVTGNSISADQVITVQDVTKPGITVPANVTLNCQDDNSTSANGTATGTDNCSPVAITYSDASTQNANVNSAAHYNYVITRTWTATDVTGNATSANQVITVQDITKPGITVPASVTLNCQDDNSTTANGTATGTDNCSPVAITYSDASTQNANVNNAGYYNYVITRTWTATDVTGNSTSADQTITVQDVTKPGITVPANVTLNCQDDNSTTANGTATGTDNCSPVAITYSDASTQNANANNAGHYNYVITRTWTATDVTGNATSANQVITVQDITAPSITCPANATVSCKTSVADNGSATGSDNCAPVAITSSDVSTQNSNPANSGYYNYTITRTWKATDVSGNFTTCDQVITVHALNNAAVAVSPVNTINANHQIHTIYLGYGPQSVTLSSTVQDGVGPRNYSWTPITGCATPASANASMSPLVSTVYTVTITDATGCSITQSMPVQVIDVRCGNKVKICHYPPGNPANTQQQCLPTSAIAAHLAHGCVLGDCPSNKNSGTGDGEEGDNHGVKAMVTTDVKVYPNPNTGAFTVELPAGLEKSEVVITDMAGKVIQKQTALEGNKLQFDLGPVARGMYMLHLTNGSQNFRTRISVQ